RLADPIRAYDADPAVTGDGERDVGENRLGAVPLRNADELDSHEGNLLTERGRARFRAEDERSAVGQSVMGRAPQRPAGMLEPVAQIGQCSPARIARFDLVL